MSTQEWLIKLISFNTISSNSNLALIATLDEWFKAHNVEIIIIKDPAQDKANLIATLPSKEGKLTGGLLFSAHTDVVPVAGQKWDTNPFDAFVKDDAVYGRGAADMKGFIAVLLALLPALQKMQLSFPIHFAFSYDEEIGCFGAPFLIDEMLKLNRKPEACVVGEPTEMKVIVGHKGLQAYRCKVKGKAGHSSLAPENCNAIEYAAKIISFINNLGRRFHKEGPFNIDYDVPFTTITTNLITGGNALNIIPEACEFKFEFRYLPEHNPQEIFDEINSYIQKQIIPEMRQEYKDANVELICLAKPPAFTTNPNASITKIIQEIYPEEFSKVAYMTEAGLFQQAGIATIICGPGSIKQAHTANEYIKLDQLKQCEEFIKKLLLNWRK